MIYKDVLKRLDNIAISKFCVIVCDSKKGATQIAYHLANRISKNVVVGGSKVDDVRKIIELAYKQTTPTTYLFLDGEDMSLSAKNALLKITEEPPKNAYFMMCVSDMRNVLETILSRAMLIKVPMLSTLEIEEYVLKKNKKINFSDFQAVKKYCHSMEQVDKMLNMGIPEFISFVQKVIDNLADVTVTNAMKIINFIAFKDEKDKYDLTLFLEVFFDYLSEKFFDGLIDFDQYKASKENTLKARQQLQISSLNKQYIFELWLMRQWEILGGENIE